MKLNSKQKIYGTVLGACAAALMVDKTFLGPSEAVAQTPSPVTPPVVAPAVVPPGEPATYDAADSARALIADRLATVADRHDFEHQAIGDAFRPAESWLPSSESAVRPVRDAGSAGDRFRQAHQLNAVMAGQTGQSSFALVDGRTLLVGQELDGFTLISVSETGALFEGVKGRVELLLPNADR